MSDAGRTGAADPPRPPPRPPPRTALGTRDAGRKFPLGSPLLEATRATRLPRDVPATLVAGQLSGHAMIVGPAGVHFVTPPRRRFRRGDLSWGVLEILPPLLESQTPPTGRRGSPWSWEPVATGLAVNCSGPGLYRMVARGADTTSDYPSTSRRAVSRDPMAEWPHHIA